MSKIQQKTRVETLAAPVPTIKDVEQRVLTESQEKAVNEVLACFSKPEYELSGVKDGESGALKEDEKFWLTHECIQRYLRAVKWSSAKAAIKRLEDTLRWRREFGLYDDRFTPEHVEPEALTGKEVIFGYDVNGRPALYLCPSKQNTDESVRQVEFNMFMLERCIDLMGPGVESVALMIDYGQKSAKSPSYSLSKMVLNILQTHYPERLGRALIINVPFLLNAFYKFITPFIDPVTRDKMRFNPKVIEDGLFTSENVWKEFGGGIDFQYDHETYWPHFIEMTTARRKAQMERWRTLGGRVGIKEWDIKEGQKLSSSEEVKHPEVVEAAAVSEAVAA